MASKKIVLLSHCILNGSCELPAASAFFRKGILEILLQQPMDIIQLPCPELNFQGLERTSITFDSSDAGKYRAYCKDLLSPLLKTIEDYMSHGISLAGIIGIDTSPSCSVANADAIMIKVLEEGLKAQNVQDYFRIDMPVGSPEDSSFLIELDRLSGN